jgi:O-antigen ligase/tetratricopeptide (TPR) repeat protein
VNPEKKKVLKRKKKEEIKQDRGSFPEPIQLLFGLIVVAYIFIPTFTPNWKALDTNAPKFFTTALLNFLVFAILLFGGYLKKNPGFLSGFFRGSIGIVYSGFLMVSLISFTQSVNLLESVLQFTKIFTVFAAVFNLALILMRDLRLAKFIVMVITGLLIFDSIAVFYHINKFISGEIAAITDIKTVYSNKNILASAIYVKLAFALWLLVFEKGWLRIAGLVAFAFGVAATFFMATRTFYLGLLILYLIFISYNIALYIRYRQKRALWLTASSIGAIMIAFFAFTFVQQYMYPEHRGRHTQGILKQLSTLKNFETASRNRSDAWRWSIDLIKEKPLLGIGSGNWKIEILKHENQQNPGFIYLHKTHNDFLETTAETGIIGGLLFLGIFIMILRHFIMHYMRKGDDPENLLQYLFLAAAGVGFYSVDAFFNFPADRPEILALFIIFVSTGIGAAYHQQHNTHKNDNTEPAKDVFKKKWHTKILAAVFISLLSASAWILYVNFQSSKTQRIVYQEIMAGELKEPSVKIIAGFPFIPNVSIWGEPISTLKARYLIEEEKYEEAIAMLQPNYTSPWDARPEFYMAMAFNELKQYDSALYYFEIAARLKPNYFGNIYMAASLLERKGEDERAADYYENYLEKNKKDSQAWLVASNFFVKSGDFDKAYELINEAVRYHRRDTLIQKKQRFLEHKLFVETYNHIYRSGVQHYHNKEYRLALNAFDEYLEKVSEDANAFQMRSITYYYLDDHEKSIVDANRALEINPTNALLINLKGVCYRALDNLDVACDNFRESMELGNASGKANYERFCAEK